MTTKFQRRHYEVIADAIADIRNYDTSIVESQVTQRALGVLAMRFADEFERDNPLFDAEKFYKRIAMRRHMTARDGLSLAQRERGETWETRT